MAVIIPFSANGLTNETLVECCGQYVNWEEALDFAKKQLNTIIST